MQKRQFLFSNDLKREAKILGFLKTVIGFVCLGLLLYHIWLYSTKPESRNAKIRVKAVEDNGRDRNPVANFLIWGSDRRLLMITLPYLDCIGFTGLILIWATHRHLIELYQLCIIFGIIFSMADMILIIPSVAYGHDKILILSGYIFSSIRKVYEFWILKKIMIGLRAEAESQEETDFETSSLKRY